MFLPKTRFRRAGPGRPLCFAVVPLVVVGSVVNSSAAERLDLEVRHTAVDVTDAR
ncbi:MAG TPA: hypothetical protein VG013_23540 [Gemmataceae bacterium]|jgi:hypothetical protein|nr:hypothetical protein [Gemmataceae bacterium]